MIDLIERVIKFYKDLPIKRKMLGILYIQMLIPLLLIGFTSFKISENIVKEKSKKYSRDIIKTVELRLNDYTNSLSNLTQSLLYDDDVYRIISSQTQKYDQATLSKNDNIVNNILHKYIFSREDILSICLIKNDGYYFISDNNSKNLSVLSLVKNDSLLNEVKKKSREKKGRIFWYQDYSSGKSEMYLVRTIYDRETYKEIGLLTILLKREHIENVYESLITEDMKNILVISATDEIIVSRNPENIYLMSKNIINNMKGNRGWIFDNKSETLVTYVVLKNTGWKVMSYIQYDILYKEANDLKTYLLVICLVIMVILAIINMSISNDLIDPINRLVEGMNTLQSNLKSNKVKVYVDRNDELGEITKQFNIMSERIGYLIHGIYSEQITRKVAQLKALQAQINPHFLYNTLDSINWMAQLNNVPEISDMVTALASLMRASIGRDDKLITIKEEFGYIEDYIFILQNRFDEKLSLNKKILSEEALDKEIPRLLIQPIVENSIQHGISKSRKKGIITISLYIQDKSTVKILVTDNGVGIDPEKLKELNTKLSYNNDKYFMNLSKKVNGRIGIENVNRRIKLFYGEQFGLKIESEKDEYTRVIVTIPLNQQTLLDEYKI